MKARLLSVVGAFAVPLTSTGESEAGFLGLVAVSKPNPFGILTYNIYAQFDERPGDFVQAVAGTPVSPMNVNVRGGTFYQNPFNGDLPPNPAFCDFPGFESVCYDTFVTIGKKTSIGDATDFVPGWPGFGPDRLAGNSIGWFIRPGHPQGDPANNQVLLMQLSTQNGVGFSGTIVVFGLSNGLYLGSVPSGADVDGYVSFDTQQAPAPGALAILGVAGLLGSRRSRGP